MKTIKITVYLCSTSPSAVGFQNQDEPQKTISISKDDETNEASISVPIKHVPQAGIDDCEIPIRVLQLALVTESVNIIDCLWPGPADLRWVRDVTHGFPDNYLTIDWSNPQDNCSGCFWWSTTITAKNPTRGLPNYPFIVSSGRKWSPAMYGEIPLDGEDAWLYPVPDNDVTYESQPSISPGESLQVYWEMKIQNQTFELLMREFWFKTPMATGGIIKSVSNQFEIDQTWEVEVEGVVVSGVPSTDFAQYGIGSFVYLLKQEEEEAGMYMRDQAYNGDEENFTVRLVPIDFKGLLPVEGFLQTMDYDLQTDFQKAFELSVLAGVITEMTGLTATVEVTIPTPSGSTMKTFNKVAIFYHCAKDIDVEFGHLAFSEGDAVILLNDRSYGSISSSDLSVIGFIDELKLCSTEFFIKPTFNSHTAIKGGESITFTIPELGETTSIVFGTDNLPEDFDLEDVGGMIGPFETSQTLPESPIDVKFENNASRSYFSANARNDADGNTEINIWNSIMYESSCSDGISSDGTKPAGWELPDNYNIRYKYDKIQYRVCSLDFSNPTTEIIDGKSYDIYEMDFSDLKRVKRVYNNSSYSWPYADEHGIDVQWMDVNTRLPYGPTLTLDLTENNFMFNSYYYRTSPGDAYAKYMVYNTDYRGGGYCYINEVDCDHRHDRFMLYLDGTSTSEEYMDSYTIWTDADGGNPQYRSVTTVAEHRYNLQFWENLSAPNYGEWERILDLFGFEYTEGWNWEQDNTVACSMESVTSDIY